MLNCWRVRRHMLDADEPWVREHLAGCSRCRALYDETARVLASLDPGGPVRASDGFKERVMNRLTQIEAEQTAAIARRATRPATLRFVLAGAVALALILGLPYLSHIGKGPGAPVTALLAQSAESLEGLSSVHLSLRMRTLPGDNFELIGLDYDFVPLEIWKDFGTPQRWRIEKPGRVAVMDGASTLMLMGGNRAIRGGVRTGFVEWLMPLLEPQKLLEQELAAAQKERIAASLSEERSGDARVAVLRMAPKAKGDFTNDWTRNKSIPESDHTRVYRFDVQSKRLTGLQVLVGNTVVLETTAIRYNEPIDPATFALALPENVTFSVPPDQMPANRPLPQTARETAVRFFESLATRDWEGARTVSTHADDERFQRIYGGLTVISIGEPFQSGLYAGWFVPYQIKLPNGEFKQHKLAVRNDNRAHRWHTDGGY